MRMGPILPHQWCQCNYFRGRKSESFLAMTGRDLKTELEFYFLVSIAAYGRSTFRGPFRPLGPFSSTEPQQ